MENDKSPIIPVAFTSERVMKYANRLLAGDSTDEAFESVFHRPPTAKDIATLETNPEYHATIDAVRETIVRQAIVSATGFYAEGMKTMWSNFQDNQKILSQLYTVVADHGVENAPKDIVRNIERFARLNNDIYKEMKNKYIELMYSDTNNNKTATEELWEEFD